MKKIPKVEILTRNFNMNNTSVDSKKQIKKETIDQLKNVEQEEKIISVPEVKNKIENLKIKSLEDFIVLCEQKKELKIKYELENNLRLVSFKNQNIEISFNSNLDKAFVKELSAKLLEWTNNRWIIAFSKENGFPTLKERKKKLAGKFIKK